jgi:hypothetical protein
LFVRDPEKTAFEYKVIFHAKDQRDITWDWKTNTEQQVILNDPRPNRRTVTFVPAVDPNMVSMIFVDVTYRDDENSILAQQSFTFDAADGKLSQDFSVALADYRTQCGPSQG